jgi:hypothetical protein
MLRPMVTVYCGILLYAEVDALELLEQTVSNTPHNEGDYVNIVIWNEFLTPLNSLPFSLFHNDVCSQ